MTHPVFWAITFFMFVLAAEVLSTNSTGSIQSNLPSLSVAISSVISSDVTIQPTILPSSSEPSTVVLTLNVTSQPSPSVSTSATSPSSNDSSTEMSPLNVTSLTPSQPSPSVSTSGTSPSSNDFSTVMSPLNVTSLTPSQPSPSVSTSGTSPSSNDSSTVMSPLIVTSLTPSQPSPSVSTSGTSPSSNDFSTVMSPLNVTSLTPSQPSPSVSTSGTSPSSNDFSTVMSPLNVTSLTPSQPSPSVSTSATSPSSNDSLTVMSPLNVASLTPSQPSPSVSTSGTSPSSNDFSTVMSPLIVASLTLSQPSPSVSTSGTSPSSNDFSTVMSPLIVASLTPSQPSPSLSTSDTSPSSNDFSTVMSPLNVASLTPSQPSPSVSTSGTSPSSNDSSTVMSPLNVTSLTPSQPSPSVSTTSGTSPSSNDFSTVMSPLNVTSLTPSSSAASPSSSESSLTSTSNVMSSSSTPSPVMSTSGGISPSSSTPSLTVMPTSGGISPSSNTSSSTISAIISTLLSSATLMTPPATAEFSQVPIFYGVVAGLGALVAVLLVVVVVMALVICCGRRRPKVEGNESVPLEEVVALTYVSKSSPEKKVAETTLFDYIPKFQKVPLEQLEAYVIAMNDDQGKDIEYSQIKSLDTQPSCAIANLPANAAKNRYVNILAHDMTRVILGTGSDSNTNYINANFISGFKHPKEYIACQGPLPHTINDFWEMVWEQNTCIIVMVTNLVEKGTTKCEEYWPTQGPAQFGMVEVVPIDQRKCRDYIRRTFNVHQTTTPTLTRKVQQFHFVVWPDFGVPSDAGSMVTFVRAVRSEVLEEHGPMVVHCSAGVGRTGTFIAIDVQLQRLLKRKPFNVQEFVCQMRAERSTCVQTKEQYKFIYNVVLHALLYGNTQMSAQQLKEDIKNLGERVDREFKMLQEMSAKTSSWLTSVAIQSENASKNRSPQYVPLNKNRVLLEGNGVYINASWIEGLSRQPEFIITQHPLKHTMDDFWMMVLQKEVSTVVMIGPHSDKDIQYWPEGGMEVLYNTVVVRAGDILQNDIIVRKFHISSEELKVQRVVTHFQLWDWPEIGLPSNGSSMMSLVKQSELHRAANGGIIAAHSSSSIQDEAAGVFIALSLLCAQLASEESVDVFDVVGKLRSERPAILSFKGHYEFIYQALISENKTY